MAKCVLILMSMKISSWEDLLRPKYAITILVLVSALVWATTITPEFSGYDDIKLIVNNERIHKGPLYTAKFYGNIVSDSHNVAWTNYPTVIYRPLEWFGSSVGYMLWGPHAVPFHIFFNINFHIINTILLFLIMLKAFAGAEAQVARTQTTKNKHKNFKEPPKKELKTPSSKSSPRAVFMAWLIALIWTVHPLHCEALNMLTSGVGFLWATFFCLSAFTINLYFNDYNKLRDLSLIAWSCICFVIGYLGSEMAIIGPLCLFLFFVYQKLVFNQKLDWIKISLAFFSIYIYMSHRSSIVSETHAWSSNGLSELLERVTIVSPEIFFHYIKLFFFPAVLSIDQHHQVILADAFSPYHLLCFTVSLIFFLAIFYYGYLASQAQDFVRKQALWVISFSTLLTGLSLGIALNIIPLYVLARERYCYIFCLGMTTLLVFLIYYYGYATKDNPLKLSGELNFKDANPKDRLLSLLVIVAVLAFGIRASIRNLEWHNGEKIWYSTINSVKHDIGVQQVWRSRLLDYYKDPGTKTFKPNPALYQKAQDDFLNFIDNYDLNNFKVFESIKAQSTKSKIVEKYAYTGAKTIASGLFFLAMRQAELKKSKEAFRIFRLGHNYYPEHFQININLLVQLYGHDDSATDYLLRIMDQEASNNPFLAKGFMDTLHILEHPAYFELAKKYRDLNPNTQVFDVFLFNAAYLTGHYDDAYAAAKRIVTKFHEERSYDRFIELYEANQLSKVKL